MNNKKNLSIYHEPRFSEPALAYESPELIYFRLTCPHCAFENVITKEFIHKMMLCSSSGCRRIIVVENYLDLLVNSEDEKQIA